MYLLDFLFAGINPALIGFFYQLEPQLPRIRQKSLIGSVVLEVLMYIFVDNHCVDVAVPDKALKVVRSLIIIEIKGPVGAYIAAVRDGVSAQHIHLAL